MPPRDEWISAPDPFEYNPTSSQLKALDNLDPQAVCRVTKHSLQAGAGIIATNGHPYIGLAVGMAASDMDCDRAVAGSSFFDWFKDCNIF